MVTANHIGDGYEYPFKKIRGKTNSDSYGKVITKVIVGIKRRNHKQVSWEESRFHRY